MSDMMNQAYQEILSCQVEGGGFSINYGGRLNIFIQTEFLGIFCNRVPSVWLTSYATKILDESLSEVSQRFGFSVDLQVIESAVEWTITQQLAGGSFQEVEMFPDSSQAPVEFQEISVTSQVVIMLASLRNINKVSHLQ